MTTIGPSTVIAGDITTDQDLVVNGRVEGPILVRNAVLTIGEQAHLESDVRAARVIVRGTLKGSISASDRIELLPSARVTGSLSASRIVIADGATFNGHLDMGQRTIAGRVAQYKAAQTAAR